MQTKVITRDEAINNIIEDDRQDIIDSGADDYLEGILRLGTKGYDDFTMKELAEEYQSREFDDGVEKIVIKGKNLKIIFEE